MSDALGYAAALAVLTSFLMQSMVPLRLIAILSNLLFLSYGYVAHIRPVLLLHSALLPINVARLASCPGHSLRYQRCLSLVADRGRASLFVLGLLAGSLGLRAVVHAIIAVCRCGHFSV